MAFSKNCRTFAAQLTDGVMVTLQILVLSFKVRVLVGQLRGMHQTMCSSLLFLQCVIFAFC